MMQPKVTSPKVTSNEIRARILDAAGERFRQYGYGKTTMAEIARDCGMSAANLYRYFENKHDIGSAMACQCLSSKSSELMQVVADPNLSAAEKIQAFILASLHYTHRQWSQQPRMNELVDDISQSRGDIVGQHITQMRAMIMRIIEQGVSAGEFRLGDIEASADAVWAAMFIFDYPNLMSLYPLEVFEQRAGQVGRLLVHGLRNC